VKKRLLALALALSLALTGCASVLDRDTLEITVHSEGPVSEENSAILRVETYQGLVNAILFFVLQGQQEGTLRLYNYTRDVDSDLSAACLEVALDDPLGAYAVDAIKFQVAHIVSYYEVNLSFTYRRTQEQIDSIVSVVGVNAIRQELRSALLDFQEEVVLRIGYFDGDEASLSDLLRQAYYDTPQAAFGLPQAEINLYPDSGYQRVVEFRLSYPFDREQGLSWRGQLEELAANTAAAVESLDPNGTLLRLYQTVQKSLRYDPQGENSMQAVMLELPADSHTMVLLLSLLCRQAQQPCQSVEGTLNGEPHFWAVVGTNDGWRHLDPSGPLFQLGSDAQMNARGYVWDLEAVPSCGEPIPEPEPENPEDPEDPAGDGQDPELSQAEGVIFSDGS